jgi:VWFA-related protein
MAKRVAARCSLALAVGSLSIALTLAQGTTSQTPPPQNPPPQTPPPQTPAGQAPVFRAGVNLVTVDAYPVRDGQIVEGLTPADFEILEDGKPQKIDQFEFVRIEPTPAAVQRDPNTVGESLKLAADPHNRVFVVFLDQHFVRMDGSHDIRRPLVKMLDGILAANDLFGVLTPRMRPSDVALARRVLTVEDELAKYWIWGMRDSAKLQPEGELGARCYETPQGTGFAASVVDPTPIRPIPAEVLQRSYEDHTLTQLEELIAFLGRVREARSSAIVVTDGWLLYGRNEALANNISQADGSSFPPGVFVGPGGKIGQGGSRDPNAMGGKDIASCTAEMVRLARMDDQQRLRDLIALANRNNVTFNAVNPSGLSAFDQNPASMTPIEQAAIKANTAGGNLVSGLTNNLQNRIDTLLTLTKNTDGIAIVNTNDLTGGLKRIVDENSAYYLIGYYSTNTKLDGKYRRLDVRVSQPKIHVAARRGYVAGLEGDKIARAPAPSAAQSSVGDALAELAKSPPDAALVVRGTAAAGELTVVAEIASHPIEMGQWADGADVQVFVTDPNGQELPPVQGKIEAGRRSVALKVPVAPDAAGPWSIRAKVRDRSNTVEDRGEVRRPSASLLGAALLSRGTPSARSALLPVAGAEYRRTERVHVDWPVLKPLDRREARLLGRDGQPLAISVTVTEREVEGRPTLSADAVLGPLAPGDYLIELTVGAGGEEEKPLVAIRVVR